MGYHPRMPKVALVEDTVDTAEILRIMLAETAKISDLEWFATGRSFLSAFRPGLFALILPEAQFAPPDDHSRRRSVAVWLF